MSVHISIGITKIFRNLLRMTSTATIEAVKKNAATAKQTLDELKNELNSLNTEYNNAYAEYLREENRKLLLAVEEAKNKLIQIEVQNGIPQIPLPGVVTASRIDSTVVVPPQVEEAKAEVEAIKKVETKNVEKPKKEKKVKEAKPKAPTEPELPIDVGRLDLRIAKVEDVQRHPDADSLYVLKINCGEENPRTVCSGLVKYVPLEELENRFVMLLCNLKPAKMRGIMSEAMVMCASTADKVEVLIPPNGCQPGDLVHCNGYTRQPDAVMNPKKKIFESVSPDLHTDANLQACYKGVPFNVPGKGNVTTQSLKNVPVK